MDQNVLYFEGSAVVTNVISAGSSFVVTEHGDAYVPRNLTKGYNLSLGDNFTARIRKNHQAYGGSCEFIVIDIITTPTSELTVTAHTSDTTYEEETLPSFAHLTDIERWESILGLSDSDPMFTLFDLMKYIGEEHATADYDLLEEYIADLVMSKKLWAVEVYQGSEDDTDFAYHGYMVDPNVKFNGHFMFYHAEYQKVGHPARDE